MDNGGSTPPFLFIHEPRNLSYIQYFTSLNMGVVYG